MSKGIRFTDEFKQDAVAQVVERGYAVSEVAERLGINSSSRGDWHPLKNFTSSNASTFIPA
jgi:transposase